ncbi:hypothetical protein [Mesorhizobium sp. Cs1321R2N1]|uniref:hypothetical protein n=1 Tax=Mesorhizobium sp. Cs1321R2N1 TaxID=3015174 RepID=UPI00301CCEBB
MPLPVCLTGFSGGGGEAIGWDGVVTQDVPDQTAETTWSDFLRALTLKQYLVFGSAEVRKPTLFIVLVSSWCGVVW